MPESLESGTHRSSEYSGNSSETNSEVDRRCCCDIPIGPISPASPVGCMTAAIWIVVLAVSCIVLFFIAAAGIGGNNLYNFMKVLGSILSLCYVLCLGMRKQVIVLVLLIVWAICGISDFIFLVVHLSNANKQQFSVFLSGLLVNLILMPIDIFTGYLYFRLYTRND